MKKLLLGVLFALLAPVAAAQASTVDLTLTGPNTGNLGSPITFGVDWAVALQGDAFNWNTDTAEINFGDGSPSEPYTVPSAILSAPTKSGHVDFLHSFLAVGNYTVTAILTGFFTTTSFAHDERSLSRTLDITISISRGPVAVTPIPAALPLFASALGALGFFGWRRRRAA